MRKISITTQIKKRIARAFSCLVCPSRMFAPSDEFSKNERKMSVIALTILYMIIGFSLNLIWPFPYFFFTVCFFISISLIVCRTIRQFIIKMKDICTELFPMKPFEKANYFYLVKSEKSIVYIVFPISFVCIFGIGGVALYSSIMITPTLVWMLILFSITVYLSMIAYSQYIRFSYYLYLSANNEYAFENIICPGCKELPPKLSWQVSLAKLSHLARNMFFLVGALYIFGFGWFCFSKVYQVDINAYFFYLLWIVIFVFIVLMLPITTWQNYVNIRKIVDRTKNALVAKLLLEKDVLFPDNSIMSSIFRNQCISIVLSTRKYPLDGSLNIIYTVSASIINLLASIATILQYQAGLHS